VPGQAERPATLTADTLGDTIALGVTPVVASDVPDYMRGDASDVRVVKDTDISGIRAATPDVILGTKQGQGSEYAELTKIAPTIMTDDDDWKLNLREHGEALGRTNDAEKLLIDWDNRVARVKRAMGAQRVSVVVAGGKQVSSVGQAVLDDLGIGIGTGGAEVIRLRPNAEWVGDGGLLGARAALEDVARAL
jgi:ABC-type Fe3+-hydroxamate transport system substrate-binding protein